MALSRVLALCAAKITSELMADAYPGGLLPPPAADTGPCACSALMSVNSPTRWCYPTIYFKFEIPPYFDLGSGVAPPSYRSSCLATARRLGSGFPFPAWHLLIFNTIELEYTVCPIFRVRRRKRFCDPAPRARIAFLRFHLAVDESPQVNLACRPPCSRRLLSVLIRNPIG